MTERLKHAHVEMVDETDLIDVYNNFVNGQSSGYLYVNGLAELNTNSKAESPEYWLTPEATDGIGLILAEAFDQIDCSVGRRAVLESSKVESDTVEPAAYRGAQVCQSPVRLGRGDKPISIVGSLIFAEEVFMNIRDEWYFEYASPKDQQRLFGAKLYYYENLLRQGLVPEVVDQEMRIFHAEEAAKVILQRRLIALELHRVGFHPRLEGLYRRGLERHFADMAASHQTDINLYLEVPTEFPLFAAEGI